jgi:hypothetical protein
MRNEVVMFLMVGIALGILMRPHWCEELVLEYLVSSSH